jgi:hypothetical protein
MKQFIVFLLLVGMLVWVFLQYLNEREQRVLLECSMIATPPEDTHQTPSHLHPQGL